MSLLGMLPQTARIDRYAVTGLDDFGNEEAIWGEWMSVNARFENFSGKELREDGREVNVMRWRCYLPATADGLTVDDRIVDPDADKEFRIIAIDRQFGMSSLHHLVAWLEEVID